MEPKVQKNLNNQIQATKAYLRFCNNLFKASSLEDFLSLLYKETNRQFKTRSLVFCWSSGHFGPLQYICHSGGLYKKTCHHYKQYSGGKAKQIQVKREEDSQYLMTSLGRPVQNILSIPIRTNQYGKNTSIRIFVEFYIKNHEILLSFYESFLPLITKCVDRLLWKDHLETSIELWTSTFNELNEPLAIFDEKNNLNQANNIFNKIFDNMDHKPSSQPLLHWQKRIFERHSYFVNISNKLGKGPLQKPSSRGRKKEATEKGQPDGEDGEKKNSSYTVYHYTDISESLILRNKMIQNIKLAALGDLGEAIAHQLSNPLAGVLSMAQWILQSSLLNKETKKDMQDIVEGVSRSQEIISQLLDFSRTDSQLNIYDLNEVVRKTLPFVKSMICFSDFHVELYKKPLFVNIQPGLLKQVIFNLLKNACQAVAELNRPPQQIKINTKVEDSQGILHVEDNGKGIRTSDYENVFKPFFTTKNPNKGTGLGLNMSRHIVESFKGNLKAGRSSLGGARFTLSLPLEESRRQKHDISNR
ncbi:MAG: ATP-binding protein [Bdellovibrionales bacterium]|nr:ATP-binding protein [Bdellovibrionales bacterium]